MALRAMAQSPPSLLRGVLPSSGNPSKRSLPGFGKSQNRQSKSTRRILLSCRRSCTSEKDRCSYAGSAAGRVSKSKRYQWMPTQLVGSNGCSAGKIGIGVTRNRNSSWCCSRTSSERYSYRDKRTRRILCSNLKRPRPTSQPHSLMVGMCFQHILGLLFPALPKDRKAGAEKLAVDPSRD